MKVATAVLVGLIAFSYAGVAAAGSRCGSSAPSAPKSSGSSSYVMEARQSQAALLYAMFNLR